MAMDAKAPRGEIVGRFPYMEMHLGVPPPGMRTRSLTFGFAPNEECCYSPNRVSKVHLRHGNRHQRHGDIFIASPSSASVFPACAKVENSSKENSSFPAHLG